MAVPELSPAVPDKPGLLSSEQGKKNKINQTQRTSSQTSLQRLVFTVLVSPYPLRLSEQSHSPSVCAHFQAANLRSWWKGPGHLEAQR